MRKLALFSCMVLFLTSLAAAQPATEPSKYYGSVAFDTGEAVDSGTVLAVAESRTRAQTEFSDGTYELVVERDSSNEDSFDSVSFVVVYEGEEISTGQSAEFREFDSQEVNLTFPEPQPETGGGDGSSGGGGGGGFTSSGFDTEQEGNAAPVAGFTWDTPVRPGEEFTLEASGSFDPDGNISEYRWSIGATGETAETVFGSPGSYPVTLTVEDEEGATTNVTKDVVVTENEAPVPSFDIVYTGSDILEDVRFNASDSYDPDGNITQYTWSFGDQDVTASDSFQESGNVTLTVVDNEGATASVTKELNDPVDTGDEDNPEQSITGAFTGSETAIVGVLALALLATGVYIVREKDLSVQVLRSDES